MKIKVSILCLSIVHSVEMNHVLSQGARPKKVIQKSLSFTSHDEREIPFDFGRHMSSNHEIGGSKKIRVVNKISRGLKVYLIENPCFTYKMLFFHYNSFLH